MEGNILHGASGLKAISMKINNVQGNSQYNGYNTRAIEQYLLSPYSGKVKDPDL
jgi:hypothetical protein